MPEGDTIFRAAATLRQILSGRCVVSTRSDARTPGIEKLSGARVTDVRAIGKHMLIDFETGQALHTHMGMTGSWHVYPVGTRWRKPAHRAAAMIATETHEVVCFSPQTIELLSAAALRSHRALGRLGPDLLGDAFDANAAVTSLRRREALPLGEALMNQALVCGIGNVYKSECLFLAHADPFAPVAAYDDDDLVRLLHDVRRLMRRNLGGHPRRTRSASDGLRKWVYRRSGEKCLRCGERIAMRRQGEAARSTYWCAGCQPSRTTPVGDPTDC